MIDHGLNLGYDWGMLKKALKWFLLVYGLSPLAVPFLFLYTRSVWKNLPEGTTIDFAGWINIFPWIAFLSIILLWIIYIPNALRNTTVLEKRIPTWIFLLIFGSVLVFPFYWYHHIWKDVDSTVSNKIEAS